MPRVNRAQRTKPHEMAAPVGGWNNRDSVVAMRPEDAISLVNWFPSQGSVNARRGYARLIALAGGQSVQQLIPYEVGAVSKLLAMSGGKLFDTAGGAELATGKTSNYVSYTRMGERLIMCNGVDAPFSYNGTAVVAHGFTDATATLDFSDLSFVTAFNSRIYFIEDNTQSFWYGGVGAVQGALEKFDLSLTGSFSGKLKILTAITQDGGDGADDIFVAIFSGGDVVAYKGTNPGDATNWSKVGVFKIGQPLSRFGHVANGGDVTIITSRGYETLVRSTREGEGVKIRSMASDKIQNEVTQIIKQTGASERWRVQLYNKGRMLIFQAPLASTIRHHVRNIDTGAWCRFSLPNLVSFAQLGSVLYCGDVNGVVHTFDTGDSDDGETIIFSASCAWTALGARGQKKMLHFMEFNFTGVYFPSMQISVAEDFGKHLRSTTLAIPNQEIPSSFGDSYWDDPSYWNNGSQTRGLKHKHGAEGKQFSLRLDMLGRVGDINWNSVTYYETRGGLL